MTRPAKYVMKADADVGLLTINWETRGLTVEGISGDDDQGNARTPTQVLRKLQVAEVENSPDVAVWGLVVHRDNCQLCLHDLEGFLRYVYGPEDME